MTITVAPRSIPASAFAGASAAGLRISSFTAPSRPPSRATSLAAGDQPGRADSAALSSGGVGTSGPQGRVVPFTFIDDPSAWTAANWSEPAAVEGRLVFALSPEDAAAVVAATAAFIASGAPLTALRRPRDFALPDAITVRLAAARRELLAGSGVAVLRNMPLDEIERALGDANDEAAGERAILAAYLGVAAHVGVPGPQWNCGRIVTHVTNRGGSVDKNLAAAKGLGAEAFNRKDAFEMHADSCCDVLGLLCVRQAKKGGESAFASSTAVFNEMLLRGRIDAVATLAGGGFFRDKTRFHADVSADCFSAGPHAAGPVWEMPVFSWRRGYFTSAYNANLNRQCEERYGLRLSPSQREAMALFDEIANAPEMKLSLRLQRGDIALVNNLTIMHSRSTFEDDPAAPRHLVRTWLLARDSPHSLPHRLMYPRSYSGWAGHGDAEAGTSAGASCAPARASGELSGAAARVVGAGAAAATTKLAPSPSMAAALRGGLMPSVLKMPVTAHYVPYSNGERAV